MIWATKEAVYNDVTETVRCEIECDDISEITDSITSDDVEGLVDGYKIERGSSAFSMKREICFMKSDGTWQK